MWAGWTTGRGVSAGHTVVSSQAAGQLLDQCNDTAAASKLRCACNMPSTIKCRNLMIARSSGDCLKQNFRATFLSPVWVDNFDESEPHRNIFLMIKLIDTDTWRCISLRYGTLHYALHYALPFLPFSLFGFPSFLPFPHFPSFFRIISLSFFSFCSFSSLSSVSPVSFVVVQILVSLHHITSHITLDISKYTLHSTQCSAVHVARSVARSTKRSATRSLARENMPG